MGRSRGSIFIHILRPLLIRGAQRAPRRRYGGTPGEPAAAAWDAACFCSPPTPAEKCEDTSKACREGGGTHGEAGTHTVQEAFGDRVELRLPHRGAVQGSSGGRRRGGAAESRRLQAAGRDGAAGKVMEREEGKRVEVKPRGKGGKKIAVQRRQQKTEGKGETRTQGRKRN